MTRKSPYVLLLLLALLVGALTWADYQYYRRTCRDNRKLYRAVLTLLRIYSLEVGSDEQQAHADGL
jgi:hypothetical protein